MKIETRIKIKRGIRINKLKQSFIRDYWGNLTNCYWNKMIKEDIKQLKLWNTENK